ncbi:hypothetical protein Scep_001950 [Stephania cephalantha]|uniref:Uncharacterized protein n=1 Tax=Stephania cephalantha TaxID=152367 RepID=A0AAP0LCW6_9MAGN
MLKFLDELGAQELLQWRPEDLSHHSWYLHSCDLCLMSAVSGLQGSNTGI